MPSYSFLVVKGKPGRIYVKKSGFHKYLTNVFNNNMDHSTKGNTKIT